MPYGRLNGQQKFALRRHVAGQTVHDLGSGDLGMAKILLDLGAITVVAIDTVGVKSSDPRIITVEKPFNKFNGQPADVAFVSWPSNWETGVTRLISPAREVIYLGKNTDGRMCGSLTLFEELLSRRLLEYCPDWDNTLIIVGEKLKSRRKPTGEERAALLELDADPMSFEDSERQVPENRKGGAT